MFLPIRKYFRKTETPLYKQGEFDFSNWDFPAFSACGPVCYTLEVQPEDGTARILLSVSAQVQADCARCLAPVRFTQLVNREFRVREQDLADEMAELPFTEDGSLDVQEFVFQELMLEVPSVILCKEDCEGLCQCCGKPKAECRCEPEPLGDPRLQVLRQLLKKEN